MTRPSSSSTSRMTGGWTSRRCSRWSTGCTSPSPRDFRWTMPRWCSWSSSSSRAPGGRTSIWTPWLRASTCRSRQSRSRLQMTSRPSAFPPLRLGPPTRRGSGPSPGRRTAARARRRGACGLRRRTRLAPRPTTGRCTRGRRSCRTQAAAAAAPAAVPPRARPGAGPLARTSPNIAAELMGDGPGLASRKKAAPSAARSSQALATTA
mmetsp:Transcript_12754/g.35915  ORF Transcript_12754/g.35915 Transcript_12754/m.35915 type:complete len:207 (+) Transcript_12754:359-979(+)